MPSPSVATAVAEDLRELAFSKSERVLGPRGRKLVERLLAEQGNELRTPQDLMRLADAMTSLGGFEGAVGAMLGVSAVLRGAERPVG